MVTKSERVLWLGVMADERDDGNHQLVALIDGAHSDPAGVAKARKLIQGIFPKRYGKTEFVMVELLPVPGGDQPINDEAMESCAALVRDYGVDV